MHRPRPFVRVRYRVPGPRGEPVERSIVFDTPWHAEGEVRPEFVEAEARRRLAHVPAWEAVGWEFARSPSTRDRSRDSRNRAKAGAEQSQAEDEARVRARVEAARARAAEAAARIDLGSYDYVIVAFSGGKDSLAALLYLLDLGVDPSRIELWHHDVDGREGSRLMDWPVTRDYVRRVGEALGIKTYFSWKVGGFEREMLRDQAPTTATAFETPDEGVKYAGGKSGKPGTRLKFPQVSGDLTVRWCSAYLKIDVASIALRNQERFAGRRTLFVTGERAQESGGRAEYEILEPHRTDPRAKKDQGEQATQARRRAPPRGTSTTGARSSAGGSVRSGRSSSATGSTRTRPTASAGAASRARPASSAAPTSSRRCE